MDHHHDRSSDVARPAARCPSCGVIPAEHDASPCLDRWIHEHFFRKALGKEEVAPPYSASPQQRCLDDLIDARMWPEGFAVMQTSLGCTVGRLVPRSEASDGYEYYDVVASAKTLPLAVCRAALSLSSAGNAPLRMT